MVSLLTLCASLTFLKKLDFRLCHRYKRRHRGKLGVSGGEHIKADDDDTCLVEFRLTKFSSETRVEERECLGEVLLVGPSSQAYLIFFN